MKKEPKQPERKTVRCAIYTRKSTDEGLDQEFNSLDAQREAAEAFIKSQASEGWTALPDKYDDGGFSGGNMDRPAMKRLMADVEAGKVDCIVVYKVDRLSRSLMDFSRVMETLERHGCSFVSVTQQFNTTHSMGRLTLNILLSFAQFEREIIAERTRDKMAAARKKGKWVGGHPILGYDIERPAGRLVVNAAEADVVRGIFATYREKESLLETLREVNRCGWQRKSWLTRANRMAGGGPWDKNNLYNLLTNIAYSGRVAYGGEVYPGEHDALIEVGDWENVQEILKANGKSGTNRTPTDAALRGILYCAHCNAPMLHTFSVKNKTRRYRYYSCMRAQKMGPETCPARALPASEIESFVAERIHAIGDDPALLGETVAKVRAHSDAGVRVAEKRVAEAALAKANAQSPSEEHITNVLRSFAPLWDAMTAAERARSLSLILERVAYDSDAGTLAITFRSGGFRQIAPSNGEHDHEA